MIGYKLITYKEYNCGDIVQVTQKTYRGLEQFICVLVRKFTEDNPSVDFTYTAIKLDAEPVILSGLSTCNYIILGKYIKDV